MKALFIALTLSFVTGLLAGEFRLIHLSDRLNTTEGQAEFKLKNTHTEDLKCELYAPILLRNDIGAYVERFTISKSFTIKKGAKLDLAVPSEKLKSAIGNGLEAELMMTDIFEDCSETNIVVYRNLGKVPGRERKYFNNLALYTDNDDDSFLLSAPQNNHLVFQKLDPKGKTLWQRNFPPVKDSNNRPSYRAVYTNRSSSRNHEFADDGKRLWLLFADESLTRAGQSANPYCFLRSIDKEANVIGAVINVCQGNEIIKKTNKYKSGFKFIGLGHLGDSRLAFFVLETLRDKSMFLYGSRFVPIPPPGVYKKFRNRYVPQKVHVIIYDTQKATYAHKSIFDPEKRVSHLETELLSGPNHGNISQGIDFEIFKTPRGLSLGLYHPMEPKKSLISPLGTTNRYHDTRFLSSPPSPYPAGPSDFLKFIGKNKTDLEVLAETEDLLISQTPIREVRKTGSRIKYSSHFIFEAQISRPPGFVRKVQLLDSQQNATNVYDLKSNERLIGGVWAEEIQSTVFLIHRSINARPVLFLGIHNNEKGTRVAHVPLRQLMGYYRVQMNTQTGMAEVVVKNGYLTFVIGRALDFRGNNDRVRTQTVFARLPLANLWEALR